MSVILCVMATAILLVVHAHLSDFISDVHISVSLSSHNDSIDKMPIQSTSYNQNTKYLFIYSLPLHYGGYFLQRPRSKMANLILGSSNVYDD